MCGNRNLYGHSQFQFLRGREFRSASDDDCYAGWYRIRLGYQCSGRHQLRRDLLGDLHFRNNGEPGGYAGVGLGVWRVERRVFRNGSVQSHFEFEPDCDCDV